MILRTPYSTGYQRRYGEGSRLCLNFRTPTEDPSNRPTTLKEVKKMLGAKNMGQKPLSAQSQGLFVASNLRKSTNLAKFRQKESFECDRATSHLGWSPVLIRIKLPAAISLVS